MILLGAEEAFTNIARHAFKGEESQRVTISCRIMPGELSLSFFDKGIPFDETIAGKFEPPAGADLSEAKTGGIGLFLINTIFDEVRWINHGAKGKELYLRKTQLHAEPAVKDEPVQVYQQQPEIRRQINADSLIIRAFEPGDAIQIARCFYKSYGYAFENEALFYPEHFAGLVQKGDIISFVCIDSDSNEVAGHLALIRDKTSQCAEISYAVVSPEYQNHGILHKLTKNILGSAEKAGIAGVSVNMNAHDAFSQKIAFRELMSPCAIVPGYFSGDYAFKRAAAENSDKKMSALFMFRYLKTPQTVDLHLPPHHEKIIEAIYEKAGAPFSRNASTDVVLERGEMTVELNRRMKSSKIVVELIGKDTLTEIKRARQDLSEQGGAQAVYLYLPLCQPRTKALCGQCEATGFFFTGIEPKPGGISDMLRLEYLKASVDFSTINLQDDFSKMLLEYVMKEYDRVSR
jgi:anti-sigma regulatory factor (Ser/Thr protein kinase)/N-acetylglutamate synthase-like GNAT family acetyltransferase